MEKRLFRLIVAIDQAFEEFGDYDEQLSGMGIGEIYVLKTQLEFISKRCETTWSEMARRMERKERTEESDEFVNQVSEDTSVESEDLFTRVTQAIFDFGDEEDFKIAVRRMEDKDFEDAIVLVMSVQKHCSEFQESLSRQIDSICEVLKESSRSVKIINI